MLTDGPTGPFGRGRSAVECFHKGGRRRHVVSVLIVGHGQSYGARSVLSYTRRMMQNFPSFRDSPIIPLRRSPGEDSEFHVIRGDRVSERIGVHFLLGRRAAVVVLGILLSPRSGYFLTHGPDTF